MQSYRKLMLALPVAFMALSGSAMGQDTARSDEYRHVYRRGFTTCTTYPRGPMNEPKKNTVCITKGPGMDYWTLSTEDELTAFGYSEIDLRTGKKAERNVVVVPQHNDIIKYSPETIVVLSDSKEAKEMASLHKDTVKDVVQSENEVK